MLDGELPPIVVRLEPGQAVLQTAFIFDGDEGSPSLFRSRAFAVWGRATLSRSSSWMSRFSVGATFGGFPLPRGFNILEEEGRAVLDSGEAGPELARLSATVMTTTPREFDHAPPGASAMMESLRGIGYSTPAAIADLIDNSISAGATRVRVDFTWRGADSRVRVLDDGRGMDAERLVDAMRPASQHPLDPRPPDDLGRFGLGLKTASLSQGRLLVVASRTASGIGAVRTWDLDHVAEADDWQLLRDVPADVASDAVVPADRASGTTVVIARLDRMLGGPLTGSQLDRQKFFDAARRVERHLGMTFHRYLEGPSPKLVITFNGDDAASTVAPPSALRARRSSANCALPWVVTGAVGP